MVSPARPRARREPPRPRHLRRILLAVDGSAQADDAIDLVIALAKVADAEVVVASRGGERTAPLEDWEASLAAMQQGDVIRTVLQPA